MVAVVLGGVTAVIYGAWQWHDAVRRQKPRHRDRRRGQIGCVGGAGALMLALTFMLTPQSWGNAVLLLWGCGTALVWFINERLSLA